MDQHTPSAEIKKTVFLSVNFIRLPGADMPTIEDSVDTETGKVLDLNRASVTGVQVCALRHEVTDACPMGTDCTLAWSLRLTSTRKRHHQQQL